MHSLLFFRFDFSSKALNQKCNLRTINLHLHNKLIGANYLCHSREETQLGWMCGTLWLHLRVPNPHSWPPQPAEVRGYEATVPTRGRNTSLSPVFLGAADLGWIPLPTPQNASRLPSNDTTSLLLSVQAEDAETRSLRVSLHYPFSSHKATYLNFLLCSKSK